VLGYTYSTLQPLLDHGQLHREDSRNQLLVLQKLQAGRYRHAVSNQLSLQWFNQGLPAEQQLQALAVLDEQDLGCMVRNDPAIPTQGLLRALVRMKQSGEIERILQRYGGTSDPDSRSVARPEIPSKMPAHSQRN
jgi:polar amino acid transport system substrate-binding protein